ncbi:AraC family transcriptional regulator [Paenibacillus sepulcri]|uniref:AraC family transcriptional regulator n=1 Tax=Paenibacillus sepulcri TaxID=359917 RepID=A0ABS7C785_9BACL|nr:AraC family transcriptional regulator [Paenibacillus sepulcri]
MKTRSKYLVNIFLFSLFIGMTPVIMLGFFSYSKASVEIQRKVNEGNSRILEQTQFRVEQVLKTVDTVTNQFIHSPLTISVMELEMEKERYQDFQQIRDGLYKLQAQGLGIFDVFLYNIEKNWLINNSGFFNKIDKESLDLLQDYAQMPAISQWTINREPVSGDGDDLVSVKTVNLIKRMPIISSNPDGFLVSKIPIHEIRKLLSKNVMPGAMMILDADKRVIALDGEDVEDADMQPGQITELLQSHTEEIGSFETELGQGNVMLSYRQSSYNGWVYVSSVSIAQSTRDSKAIGWFTLVACLTICALTLIIAWLGSRRIYRPVRKLYTSVLAESGEDSLLHKNEFESIELSVQRLTQSKFRMGNQIEGQIKLLKEYFFFKLFQGDLRRKEMEEGLVFHGLPAELERSIVLAVEIDTLEGTRYKEQDRSLLLFAIDNILREIVAERQRIGSVIIQDTVGVLIDSAKPGDGAFKDWIFGLAVKIQQAVRSYLHIKISIGVSREIRSPGAAPAAFKESQEALKYRLQLGQEVILFIEDVQLRSSGSIQYPQETEKELVEAVKSMDAGRAQEILHRFISEVTDNKIGCNQYEISLSLLLGEMVRLAKDSGLPWNLIDDKNRSLFGELLHLKTGLEVENWFCDNIIFPVIRFLTQREETQYRRISDEIIKIIHADYDKMLTLDACAARVNYHPHYVSRVFSREMGTSFADYLSQYRLLKAKEWLQSTDLKIVEIALKLHYTNPQNFIRSFRKIVGMTPGQYRTLFR